MLTLEGHPLALVVAIFLASAAVIGVSGVALSRTAADLAGRTGLGQALVGGLLLGGATSLSGLATSVAAAAEGHPSLAVSNAVGGIAAQTAFIGIADVAYRRVNLEHAAASAASLTQSALLLALLALPLVAMSAGEVAAFGVHPVSIAIVASYGFGLRLVSRAETLPMWRPRRTRETVDPSVLEGRTGSATTALWLQFACLAAVVSLAGAVIAASGVAIAGATGVSEGVVGAVLTAVATSLPELVTAVAAVRRGALTLAVGAIIGGNSFDVLMLACSDAAFRDGSIYHALTGEHVFLVSLTMLLTAVLLLGMLRREEHGIGNVGFEGVLISLIYLGGIGTLALSS